MNAQKAFEAGYAPFQEIQILHDNGKPCGVRPAGHYDHHAYGSSWIVTGVLYHRPDGRIGLAH